jgi:NTE family protein
MAPTPLGRLAQEIPQRDRPRIALVIGSGGIKGSSFVGLWRVLERERIPIDLVVGCSAGSVLGAMVVRGLTAAEAEEKVLGIWRGMPLSRMRLPALLRSFLPRRFGFRPYEGLLDDRGVAKVLDSVVGDADFSEALVPFFVAATDLETGSPVELNTGRLFDALRASVAIPIFLPPWRVKGRLLVDGAVADPLPLSIAIRGGADIILAMGFESPMEEKLDSLPRLLAQTTSIAVNQLLRSTFAFYGLAHHAEVLPILPEFDRPIGNEDIHLIPYMIDQGEAAAQAEVPYLRRLIAAHAGRSAARSGEAP